MTLGLKSKPSVNLNLSASEPTPRSDEIEPISVSRKTSHMYCKILASLIM